MVSNDQVAAGIVTCSKENVISIPDELVIGFDNQPIAKIMNITTIAIPLVEMGRKLLLRAISNEDLSCEEIAVKLVERLTKYFRSLKLVSLTIKQHSAFQSLKRDTILLLRSSSNRNAKTVLHNAT